MGIAKMQEHAGNDPDYADRLINEQEAANFLGYSVRALQNWRLRGGGPEYVRVSRRSVRYRRRELIRWADEKLEAHTSEPELGEAQAPPAAPVTSASAAGRSVSHPERRPGPVARPAAPAGGNVAAVTKPAQTEPAAESPEAGSGNPFDPFGLMRS